MYTVERDKCILLATAGANFMGWSGSGIVNQPTIKVWPPAWCRVLWWPKFLVNGGAKLQPADKTYQWFQVLIDATDIFSRGASHHSQSAASAVNTMSVHRADRLIVDI